MLSDLSPNTVCFFLLEDSSRVPQERDPRQRPLLAYLGVTKFELEFVLAPDQYLKNKWGLKAPGTHSEAPGVIPSSLRWTGAKFRIQQNTLKVLFNHNRKTASSTDSICSSHSVKR